MPVEVGDIAAYAMSAKMAQITQTASIAAIKAQNEATQALIDMVSQSVDNSRSVSASTTHGRNVDITV